MKKMSIVFGAVLSLFFIACEGPVGPPGYDGLDGFDGRDGLDGRDGQERGTVVDITGDFVADDFSLFYEFIQDDIEVFETDIVLVYLLWDQTEDGNGDPVDIWRLLPQTRLLDQGILQYNYDFTFFDVNIFLEADFDLNTLPSGDTDAQTFRIAIVPAEMLQGSRLDRSNVRAVMNTMGITEKEVRKTTLD